MAAKRKCHQRRRNPKAKRGGGRRPDAKTAATPTQPTALAANRAVAWPSGAGDKPTTMGGAMKWIAKQLAPVFTRAEIKAAVIADADWGKLHVQSPTAFSGNLIYWSNTGKLKRTGADESERFELVDLNF